MIETSQKLTQCLILGGKGFIGSHLVEALLARGFLVRVLDRPNIPVLIAPDLAHQVEWMDGDFENNVDVSNALRGCDLCFHLVSSTMPKSSNDDPAFDVRSNVVSTIDFLDHAVKEKVRKVIFLSSGGTVYGRPRYTPIDEGHPTDPLCSYGIGKLAIEKYLALYQELYGMEYAVLRLSNPFGERQRTNAAQGAVAVFLGKALRREAVDIWGDGSIVRDYLYIADAVEAMIAAIDYRGKERVFNIGSGQAKSILEILLAIEQVTGRLIERRFMPGRLFDVQANILAIDKARTELGWAPRTDFQSALARTYHWLEAQKIA